MSTLSAVLQSIKRTGLPREEMFAALRDTEHGKATNDVIARLMDSIKQNTPGAYDTYFARNNPIGKNALQEAEEMLLTQSPDRLARYNFIEPGTRAEIVKQDPRYDRMSFYNIPTKSISIDPRQLTKDASVLAHENQHAMVFANSRVNPVKTSSNGIDTQYFMGNKQLFATRDNLLGTRHRWGSAYNIESLDAAEVDAMLTQYANLGAARRHPLRGQLHAVKQILNSRPEKARESIKKWYDAALSAAVVSGAGVGMTRTGE